MKNTVTKYRSFRIRGLFIMNPLLCCLDYFVQIQGMIIIIIILPIQKMHAIHIKQKTTQQRRHSQCCFVYFVHCCCFVLLTLDAFIKRMASSKSSRSTRWENRARAWAFRRTPMGCRSGYDSGWEVVKHDLRALRAGFFFLEIQKTTYFSVYL